MATETEQEGKPEENLYLIIIIHNISHFLIRSLMFCSVMLISTPEYQR